MTGVAGCSVAEVGVVTAFRRKAVWQQALPGVAAWCVVIEVDGYATREVLAAVGVPGFCMFLGKFYRK